MPASHILTNARVVTLDDRDTIAEAIAIEGKHILAVGPAASIAAHTAPTTRVIDAKGRAVVPGLVDGHAHMDREALRSVFPSLGPVRSIAEIQAGIAELARTKAPGEWIVTMPIGEPPSYLGMPGALAEGRWPTRHDLDQAAPRNPVLIRPIWGHWRGAPPLVTCANTEALRRAGITRDTASPVPSLVIERDTNGDPTGVIVEQDLQPLAELLWFREATRFGREHRLAALPRSQQLYHGFGTTGIYEGHGVASEVMQTFSQVHRDGRLTMRSTLTMSPSWPTMGGGALGGFVSAWLGWLAGQGIGDDLLRVAGLHLHVGLTPGDKMRAAAAPDTGWAGFNYDHGIAPDKARDLLVQCASNDIRIATIAGGGGLGILDLFESVDAVVPLKGRRWVVSHVNVIAPRDIERIARLGLVLTTHTNNYLNRGLPALAERVPRDAHETIMPMNMLREAGVVAALATDNVPISLWHPVRQVVARRNIKTGEVVGAGQALSRMEALRCASTNGAYLRFEENETGTLEPGKLADLAVLSADPLTVAEQDIAGIRAMLTMVGGRIVHEVEGEAASTA